MGSSPERKPCDAMNGLIAEGEEAISVSSGARGTFLNNHGPCLFGLLSHRNGPGDHARRPSAGMEVASIHLPFKTVELDGLLYRTPDRKIPQRPPVGAPVSRSGGRSESVLATLAPAAPHLDANCRVHRCAAASKAAKASTPWGVQLIP